MYKWAVSTLCPRSLNLQPESVITNTPSGLVKYYSVKCKSSLLFSTAMTTLKLTSDEK